MSPQADYVVSNGTGAAVRSDINGQLAAIVSNNSGASAPATTYAYMLWADTSTNLLKLRNGANSAWITVGDLTAANLGLATLASPTFTGTATIPTLTISTAANIPLGSAASPTLYFTGDSNTGLYSPGADQVALSTGGTGRLFIDSSGRCGIGTSSPGSLLHVDSGTSDLFVRMQARGANALESSFLFLTKNSGGTNTGGSIGHDGNTNTLYLTGDTSGGATQHVSIDSTGKVGIGTQTPSQLLHIQGASNPAFFARDTRNNVDAYLYASQTVGIVGTSSPHPLVFNVENLEKARLTLDGKFLVGTSSARGDFFNTSNRGPSFQVEGTTTNTSGVSVTANLNNDNGPEFNFGKSRGTNTGSSTIVSNGDGLGRISFQGADGSELVPAAYIEATVDGTPGSNDMPGRLVFSTTADGASSPTQRMILKQDGAVFIQKSDGTNGSYLAMVGGDFRIGNHSGGSANYVYLAAGGTSWTSSSDERQKTALLPIENGLDKVGSLRAVTGRYLSDADGISRSFLIAQDVQSVLPEAVDASNPDSLGVSYADVIPLLVAALKESKERIETLEAKVAALESA